MKYLFLCSLLLCGLSIQPFAGAAVPDGAEELTAHTEALSFQLLLAEVRREWQNFSPSEAEFLAAQRPLLAELTDPEQGRRRSAEVYRALLLEDYERRTAELLATFPNAPAAWRDEAAALPPELWEKPLTATFPALEQATRAALVKEQQAQLTARILPTAAELESLDDAALAPLLRDRIAAAAAIPVLAENLNYISEQLVLPILADARAQRQWQLRLVREAVLSVPGGIADQTARLQTQLTTAIAQKRQAAPDATIYDIFPGVATAVQDRAARSTAEMLNARLPEWLPQPELDALTAEVLRDPVLYRQPEAMLTAFRTRIAAETHRAAEQALLAETPEPERAEVAQLLAAIPPDFAENALQSAFEATWRPLLLTARANAVAAQFQAQFPMLVDPVAWQPAAAQLEAWQRGEAPPWEQPELLTDLPLTSAALFPETRELALQRVRRVCETARQELIDQLAIVDQLYPKVLEFMRQQLSRQGTDVGFSLVTEAPGSDGAQMPVPSATEIAATYTGQVNAVRRDRATPLAPLFAMTAAEIQMRAAAIRSELIADAGTPAPPAPTEPQEERLVELTVIISRPAEQIQVELHSGSDAANAVYQCPLRPADYQKMEAETMRKIGVWLEERLLAARGSGQPLRISIAIQVKDSWIYYRFISQLREELKTRLNGQPAEVIDSLSL